MTDRRSLPLQGHKSRRQKEGQDNRRKMRGKREERGTVIERRRGQRGPEAEHDGLRPWGAIQLKDRQRVRGRPRGTITLQHRPLNDLSDANTHSQLKCSSHINIQRCKNVTCTQGCYIMIGMMTINSSSLKKNKEISRKKQLYWLHDKDTC